MKITLDIPDNIIMCAFLNGVEMTNSGMQMFSYQLGSDDFKDGNVIKLPRNRGEE